MKKLLFILSFGLCLISITQCGKVENDYVDYVDPYIGNISHILVPTFPTTQLPNSMLRVYPERKDFTGEYVAGLPIVVTNHRERSAFRLFPLQDAEYHSPVSYNYDNEHITPYNFSVELSDNSIKVEYALSHQSAVYRIEFRDARTPSVALQTIDGVLNYDEKSIFGYQQLSNDTKVYVYLESELAPESVSGAPTLTADDCVMMTFGSNEKVINLRYGISYISCEQAKANLYREIAGYDIRAVEKEGRRIWNETLGRLSVSGGTKDEKTRFYTAYYRTFERPLCISEDGRYFSAYDHEVHEDGGVPFYVDDWLWDTYRAAHPLRSITDGRTQEFILASFLRMAEQKGDMWMPTFPEVNGDTRRMNSNHGIPVVAEAMALGLEADYPALYEICSRAVDEKTLAPWSGAHAGYIDDFYKQHGYIPALRPGQSETDENVHFFEKRQPVAVTLGTSYDQWCLYQMAQRLGMKDEAEYRQNHALDYRNIFNANTLFFHPKDDNGDFITPIDYGISGGLGAREYYGENNGWVYRWDVQHNISDLVSLMGGAERFCDELDRMFAEPMSKPKYLFYSILPDHTGNVGQFSMANEPSLHVPYLYNYAGKPWKTQKRIRQMLDTWFRNDLMGMPGDEDGGGMSPFVVFSMMGIYPVTPGTATYNIGSPMFEDVVIALGNGKTLHIIADNASSENKYVQSAYLNGQRWNKSWFSYDDIKNGAKLKLVMGPQPNKDWASAPESVPPSAESLH